MSDNPCFHMLYEKHREIILYIDILLATNCIIKYYKNLENMIWLFDKHLPIKIILFSDATLSNNLALKLRQTWVVKALFCLMLVINFGKLERKSKMRKLNTNMTSLNINFSMKFYFKGIYILSITLSIFLLKAFLLIYD